MLTRSRMPSQKRRATLSSTSASSSAVRISLSASSRSASLMRPLPRRRVEIRSRRSDRASNMGSQVSHGGPRGRSTAAARRCHAATCGRRTGYFGGPCRAPDLRPWTLAAGHRRGRRARPGRLQLLAVEPLELAGLSEHDDLAGHRRRPPRPRRHRPCCAGGHQLPSPPPSGPPPARPAPHRRSRSPPVAPHRRRSRAPTSSPAAAPPRRPGTTVTVQYVLADYATRQGDPVVVDEPALQLHAGRGTGDPRLGQGHRRA